MPASAPPNPGPSASPSITSSYVSLWGSLPLVSSVKHLGITIENKINGLKKDILVKRANFINKNNEIIQEFHFSHPETRIKLITFITLTSQDPVCGIFSAGNQSWWKIPGMCQLDSC